MRRFAFAVVVVLALAIGRMPAHAQITDPKDGGGDIAHPDTIPTLDGSGGSDGGGGGTAAPWRALHWRDLLTSFRIVLPLTGPFVFRGL